MFFIRIAGTGEGPKARAGAATENDRDQRGGHRMPYRCQLTSPTILDFVYIGSQRMVRTASVVWLMRLKISWKIVRFCSLISALRAMPG